MEKEGARGENGVGHYRYIRDPIEPLWLNVSHRRLKPFTCFHFFLNLLSSLELKCFTPEQNYQLTITKLFYLKPKNCHRRKAYW